MILAPDLWVRVIDVSRNQGPINFAKMKAAGVRGLIIRVSHGQTIDDHWEGYYRQALEAGFAAADIAFYTFINPKRGTGAQCALATLTDIARVVGHTSVGYMPDIENYKGQSPNVGSAPVYGSAFADHIREHVSIVNTQSEAFVFGYSNQAYWNGPIAPGSRDVWVGDDVLAGELDWLAARYPAYSDAAYAHYGYPGPPATWPDWAFKAQPQGPLPPRGGGWWGWQFSAGFNHQGPVYGATSGDLDLNIVHPDAWARWTGQTVVPPPTPEGDDDMLRLLVLNDSPARLFAMCDSAGRALRCEWTGPGDANGTNPRIEFYKNAHPAGGVPFEMGMATGSLINISLDGVLPPTLKPEMFANPDEILARITSGTVDTVARAGLAQLNDSVGRLGQRQSSAGVEFAKAADALLGQ